MFEIVRASLQRREAWCRLRSALWPHENPDVLRSDTERILAAPQKFVTFIAVERDVAVGFAEGSLRFDYVNGCSTSPVVFLEGIYVEPDYRRRGIARVLCNAIARWGNEQGCTEMASDALADNDASRLMHAALGFEETEVVRYFRKLLPPGIDVPHLETPRLRLRRHRIDDFDAVAKMWAHSEVVRHVSGTPSTPEQSWSRLLRYAGHWSMLGYGYWAVEERASDEFVGEAGFADYHREIRPPIDSPELGWIFSPSVWGKGYATEACLAAIAWAQANLRATQIACIIAPENAASIRVAEKCGFSLARNTTYHGDPTLLFTRDLPANGGLLVI